VDAIAGWRAINVDVRDEDNKVKLGLSGLILGVGVSF
jgi:hypothetical protein